MLIVMLAAAGLGFLLAPLNVFAALAASAICAAGAFLYGITDDFSLGHSLLIGLGSAFALQAGYLAGLVLRRPARNRAKG